jgi:hypothetical protein
MAEMREARKVIMPAAIADALAKLDQAIRLLGEGQEKRPHSNVEMAIAALESAKLDLLGQKPR